MFINRLVFAISVVLNLLLFYNLIWGESGAIFYNELYDRCATLEERIRQVSEENLALSREIRLLQTDEKYIEKIIRNRLNFVRSNEILYIFPDESKVEPSGVQSNEAKD
jgi:cell division protein FtsB